MFGFFKKKKPSNALEALIFTVYGNNPPPKRANLKEAITIASEELLMSVIGTQEITTKAESLNSGPIPYSTHDLALSVALHFFKQPKYVPLLKDAQITARSLSLLWLQQLLVAPLLAKTFEDSLYELYRYENADYQFNLGLKYDNGDGVEQDKQKAIEWYSKAAHQGHVNAQFYLGLM